MCFLSGHIKRTSELQYNVLYSFLIVGNIWNASVASVTAYSFRPLPRPSQLSNKAFWGQGGGMCASRSRKGSSSSKIADNNISERSGDRTRNFFAGARHAFSLPRSVMGGNRIRMHLRNRYWHGGSSFACLHPPPGAGVRG